MTEPTDFIRPLPITLMALLQFAKAAFLLAVCVITFLGAAGRLAYIPKLRDLTFLASHGKDPKGLLLLFLALYAAFIGSGLWRLKRWARNSLVLSSGLMLVVWLSHQDFGTSLFIMPAFSEVELQTVYILLLMDCVIFVYLKFHGGISRSFGLKVDH